MATYVDAGIVRVQTYLTRGARLRGHSLGSSQISEVSQHFSRDGAEGALEELQLGHLAPGWQFNPELGKIDGVVSLVHHDDVDNTTASDVAGRLLDALRRSWPGADLHAAWGYGSTYVDAHRSGIAPGLVGHTGRQSEPAVAEFPLARPCSRCELDAAVVEADAGASALCVDCHGRSRRVSDAQSALSTFDQLASRSATNHLAVVYVDGNAVGQLFTALSRKDNGLRRKLSAALPRATLAALDVASQTPEDAVNSCATPVLRHVVGGDDVLVSVPAPLAWRFTRRLLVAFEQAVSAEVGTILDVPEGPLADINEALRRATEGAVDATPSAAAGLVFARVKYPFALSMRAAGERLRTAKRAGGGTHAAIAWTDITIDGDDPPPWRHPWTLTDLDGAADSLDALARTGKTALHEVAGLIDPDQPMTTWCRVRTHLDRLTDANLLAGTGSFVEQAITGDPSAAMTRLLDAIGIARWWA